MNKTININLANTFFHIDEDAYLKLQRYLEAIKRSFTKSQGKDEIISDIEARIAELFTERLEHDRQVITTKEVEEIISIMGQPEDYLVDEELFEDNPRSSYSHTTKTHKTLYRDIDRKYIGGVCAGLSHYLGLDVLWVRLLFIIISILSLGTGSIIYLSLWILVPEAATTAQKISMAGDPINISNIEKKIREGFEDVTEKVKNVDYDKMGASVKKNSKNIFDSALAVVLSLFRIFAKLIGIIILITAAIALIFIFYGLFTAGTMEIWGAPWNDYLHATVNAPIWMISLLSFLAVGIPLFFLFYLGLKIIFSNLKSIGNFAKFALIGLWILSVIGISILGIKAASSYAFHGSSTEVVHPVINTTDTLVIKMASTDVLNQRVFDSDGFIISDIDRGNEGKSIYSDEVEFRIRPSENDELKIEIKKESQGASQGEARQRAEAIIYDYTLSSGVLTLDDYLRTSVDNGYRDQEVDVTIYIPGSMTLKFDRSTKHHIRTYNNMDYGFNKVASQFWRIDTHGTLICVDCANSSTPTQTRSQQVDTTAVRNIQMENLKDSI